MCPPPHTWSYMPSFLSSLQVQGGWVRLHCLLPVRYLKHFAQNQCGIPPGREAVNYLRKEVELGPISARDAFVPLGKQLYISGARFLQLVCVGR